MRMMLACAVLLSSAACGGKVFVDNGQGGAGGATSNTTGNPTGNPTATTGVGQSCQMTGCSGGSDGSCGCTAVCNMQKLEVDCKPIPGGVVCACVENGNPISMCQQPTDNACDIQAGCCANAFFGH